MAGNNYHLSVLTLNVNGLHAPIKRDRTQNWIKKQDPTMCCSQETHLTENTGLETRGGKKFSKQMDPINRQEQLYSYLTK
jgi:exonuclease III